MVTAGTTNEKTKGSSEKKLRRLAWSRRKKVVKKNQPVRVAAGCLEEVESSLDVGFDECIRRNDRSVNMGFRGKITDGVYFMRFKHAVHGVRITYVRLYEGVSSGNRLLDVGQVFRIAGIGQLIDVDDVSAEIRLQQQIPNKTGSDKTASSGNHDIFHMFPLQNASPEYDSYLKLP